MRGSKTLSKKSFGHCYDNQARDDRKLELRLRNGKLKKGTAKIDVRQIIW